MSTLNSEARVVAVSRDETHRFSKVPREHIELVPGLGVDGDAHAGATVQHLSRVRRDPTQPNRRQVHLIHRELFDEARAFGFELRPGDLGENVLTTGLDVLGLPTGTRLHIGPTIVRVTGLRNPCRQINIFRDGLLKVVLTTDDAGQILRKCGIMGVVERGGRIEVGQPIDVRLPAPPHRALEPV